jgi:hypothetical protein
VANLIASHHLAAGVTRQSWALLGGAVFYTAAMLVRHDSIYELVTTQIFAMALLLAATLSIGHLRLPTWNRRVPAVPLQRKNPGEG